MDLKGKKDEAAGIRVGVVRVNEATIERGMRDRANLILGACWSIDSVSTGCGLGGKEGDRKSIS